MSQQFCLKWNNHMNNMMDVFKNLLSTESMVDVTLACDGLSLKAHKMVLSACSPFFQSLFLENPCQHPIVILKDMKYTELKAIIEFMYHGEVNVAQEQLSALMKTAETLRVKGLAEVTNEKSQSSSQEDSRQSHTDTPPPHSKRRKVRNRKRSLSGSDYSDSEREPKIKQPTSPDIEELSGDISMDASSGQFQNVQQSRVPMQSHSSNSYHKTSSVASSQDLHLEGGTSENESEFGVEPAKLLQQTLTTDEARRSRLSTMSSSEPQRRPKSSTDHSMGMSIVPTSLPSDESSQQQPASPPDIKPELLELDPPVSPVAGPSHSSDNQMVVYGDPGPSTYQDNSALVSQDSQQQAFRHKFQKKSSANNPSLKMYTCQHCPYTTAFRSYMSAHQIKHTGFDVPQSGPYIVDVSSAMNDESEQDPPDENSPIIELLKKIIAQNTGQAIETKRLKGEVSELRNMIYQNSPVDISVNHDLWQLPLPIKTGADLDVIENFLDTSENFSEMITFLRRIGGTSLKECVYRKMSKVFGTAFARSYSLHGKKGKTPFISLTLYKAVLYSVQSLIETTETEINKLISLYLAGACDRDGGRKNRALKKTKRNSTNRI